MPKTRTGSTGSTKRTKQRSRKATTRPLDKHGTTTTGVRPIPGQLNSRAPCKDRVLSTSASSTMDITQTLQIALPKVKISRGRRLIKATSKQKETCEFDQEGLLNDKMSAVKNTKKQMPLRRPTRSTQNKSIAYALLVSAEEIVMPVMEQSENTSHNSTTKLCNSRVRKKRRIESSSTDKNSKWKDCDVGNTEKNSCPAAEKLEKDKKGSSDKDKLCAASVVRSGRNSGTRKSKFKNGKKDGKIDINVDMPSENGLDCANSEIKSTVLLSLDERKHFSGSRNNKPSQNKPLDKNAVDGSHGLAMGTGKSESIKRKANLCHSPNRSSVSGSPQKRRRTERESKQGQKLTANKVIQSSLPALATTGKASALLQTNTVADCDDNDDDGDVCVDQKIADQQEAEVMDSDSESDIDWEEVEEVEDTSHVDGLQKSPMKASPSKSKHSENLEISIKMPGKRKGKCSKTQEDIMAYIARAVKRFKKDVQVNLHKVHLLTLVAHGLYRSSVCNDPAFKAIVLSCVPGRFAQRPVRRWDVAELTAFVTWFNGDFPDLKDIRVGSEQANPYMKGNGKTEVFVAVLRALGFLARLVMSFQPITFKVSQSNKSFEGSKTKKGRGSTAASSPSGSEVSKKGRSPETPGRVYPEGSAKEAPGGSKMRFEHSPGPSGLSKEDLRKIVKGCYATTKELPEVTPVPSGRRKEDSKKIEKRLSAADENPENQENTERGVPSPSSDSKKKSIKSRVQSKSNAMSESISKQKPRSGKKEQSSDKFAKEKQKRRTNLRTKRKINYLESGSDRDNELDDESSWNEHLTDEEESESEDFTEEIKFRKKQKFSAKKLKKERHSSGEGKNKTAGSSVGDETRETGKASSSCKGPRRRISVASSGAKAASVVSKGSSEEGAVSSWIEVYIPSEKKWNCIDLVSSSVNHPVMCARNASEPLVYVLGFDNENCVKDVTSRYATDWMSKTRKLRIDEDWWSETLAPYRTKNWRIEKAENAVLQAQDMERPLPTSITEYKNHPLYVLRRHLLKFEAIYPETAATLGFCRGEAVYSRDCVHGLHTRETWMKEARVVKQGEEPYKIVKGRKKRNDPNPNAEVTCDLFGEWQTEDYKPPPAVDGKVPRNEYGNVEMFKPCMLPPGTVHIKIPGIQRVAKKLGIDCAQAVVGFDFHGGFTHPVIDGVIVCKEMEKTLLDAWRAEEKEARRRVEEKREKRVLGNWRHLVRSLRIRERLKRKYDTEEPNEVPDVAEEGEIGSEMAVSWPLNVQEGKRSVGGEGHCHVFPESGHKKDPVTGEWNKSCACGLTLPFEKM